LQPATFLEKCIVQPGYQRLIDLPAAAIAAAGGAAKTHNVGSKATQRWYLIDPQRARQRSLQSGAVTISQPTSQILFAAVIEKGSAVL
jgi:hypothetical protein